MHRFCLKVLFNGLFTDGIDTLRGPDGTYMPWYEPTLNIQAGNRMILAEPLWPGLNHYQVPIVDDLYRITATDHMADTFFNEVFSLDELQMFRCNPDNPPLMIFHGTDTTILVTPEGLIKPDIRQGIFGQLTMPVNDTTATESYDVMPVVRDVYLFPIHVLDSIYTYAPVGCIYPFDLISSPPLAIVRSNSDGFFQVPMEVGEYIYMVRTDRGFYIDAFISSHRPGYVQVFPDHVTELSIHIIDCSMWM